MPPILPPRHRQHTRFRGTNWFSALFKPSFASQYVSGYSVSASGENIPSLQDHTNDESPESDSEPAPKKAKAVESSDSDEVSTYAKKITIMGMLWLHSEATAFATPLKDDYTPSGRFENRESKMQGHVHDLRAFLPRKFHEDFTSRWLPSLFHKHMQSQRSSTASRLRALAPIFDCTDEELATKAGLCAIIHGRKTALAMMHNLPGSHNQTVYHLWGLNKTTPGAIAACTVLAIWTLLADERLQTKGAITGIDWLARFEFYLKYLTIGLEERRVSVINIFKVWDTKFFPDSDASMASHGEIPGEQELMGALKDDDVVEDSKLDDDEEEEE
ncbi:hypothetical protein C8J57DRAFT_1616055 [Mycena rebaudengoi]|nr:hypothetical protein C8J57DRAFT_1616055 [Mycena rebaudengoi]